jgi:hypothetical protein
LSVSIAGKRASDSLIREYAKYYYDQPGGKAILGNYPHDLILLKPETGACRVVAADPNWKVIYRDRVRCYQREIADTPGVAVGRPSLGAALRHVGGLSVRCRVELGRN